MPQANRSTKVEEVVEELGIREHAAALPAARLPGPPNTVMPRQDDPAVFQRGQRVPCRVVELRLDLGDQVTCRTPPFAARRSSATPSAFRQHRRTNQAVGATAQNSISQSL